jgi:hypothetical protein
MRGSILDTNKPGGDPIHEERLKRYRLSYWGSFIGSYDTAKEAYESYKIHETIRPMIDRESKGQFSIRDGNEKITLPVLQERVQKE